MAFLLPLVEAAEFLVAEYEAVATAEAVTAGSEAMMIEMGTMAEGTPLLSANALASEEATAAYGAVVSTEQTLETAQAVSSVTSRIGYAAGVAATADVTWKATHKRGRWHDFESDSQPDSPEGPPSKKPKPNPTLTVNPSGDFSGLVRTVLNPVTGRIIGYKGIPRRRKRSRFDSLQRYSPFWKDHMRFTQTSVLAGPSQA